MHEHNPLSIGNLLGAGCFHRRRIPIQAQETPMGGRGRQYPGRMSTASHSCIYVPAAWPDLQTVEYRLEKDRNVDHNR